MVDPITQTKKCAGCKLVKKVEEYTKEKRNPDGLCTYCKTCSRSKSNKWYRKLDNAKKHLRNKNSWALKHPAEYRILSRVNGWKCNGVINADGSRFKWADYQAWLAVQGNSCAICGTKDSGKYDWCVDHDHKTGVVRGILCRFCNLGLENFDERPSFLQVAINYLEKSLKK